MENKRQKKKMEKKWRKLGELKKKLTRLKVYQLNILNDQNRLF